MENYYRTNWKGKIRFLTLFIILSNSNVSIAQCLSGQSSHFSKEALSVSSGSPQLDNIIRSEYVLLSQTFGLSVDLYFGGDSYGSGNAFFKHTPYCSSPNCVGIVAVGRNLLAERIPKKYGIELTKAIMAHEFGHALQAKLGWRNSGKWGELHADFMAGYYMAQKRYITEDLLASFIREFYNMGDFGFYDPNHHGTPTERGCAFREGFFASRRYNLNLYGAYKGGVAYLRNGTPCSTLTMADINADLNQINGYNGMTDLSMYDPDLLVAAVVIVGALYIANEAYQYFDEVSYNYSYGYIGSGFQKFGSLHSFDLYKTYKNEHVLNLSLGASVNAGMTSASYLVPVPDGTLPDVKLGAGLQYYSPDYETNFPLFLTFLRSENSKGRWRITERLNISRDIFTFGVGINYVYRNKNSTD
jgi:hypothetical protein